MTDEKVVQYIIDCIKAAGIEVITDKGAMDSILGEPINQAYASDVLQKYVITYAEGNRAPDLSPRSIVLKDSNGKEKTMYSVQFYGDRPKDYVPKSINKAYKLMEQWPDGSLHALFAGTETPYPMQEWDWAKGFSADEIKGMKLAPRYGWHMGTGVPSAPHLMGIGDIENPEIGYYSKESSGHPKGSKRVWVEVSFDASTDYTDVANQNPDKKEKDIRGLVPFGGYYMFQESNLSNWVVASSIRLDRIIPEEERQNIMERAGYDEKCMWAKRCARPRLKAAATKILQDIGKTGNHELLDKLITVNRRELDMELMIAERSKGEEPTYPREGFDGFIRSYEEARNLTSEELMAKVADFMEERKAFFAREGKLKSRKLTQAEIGANRDEIREQVSFNPEWLDRQAHDFLTTDQGRVLGVAIGNTIYLDPENIRVETPIHEYTHIWDRICQKENPQLWEEGVAIMKKMKLWETIKNSPEYADIAHDDNLIASEVHSRLSAEMGKELLLQNEPKSLRDKFSKWSKKFWHGIQKSFAKATGKSYVAHLDAADFIQAPVADLITKKKLVKAQAR